MSETEGKLDAAALRAIEVGQQMARLLASVPEIELRLAIVGQLGECCGVVGLVKEIHDVMERHNRMVEGRSMRSAAVSPTSEAMPIAPALLTLKQAAAYLSVSTTAMRRLAITPLPLPGRGEGKRPRLRYRRVDLDAFIQRMASTNNRQPLVRRKREAAA